MPVKRILTINLELPSEDVEHVSFHSKTSLLDWDIVLFTPSINEFILHFEDWYQGKPSLSDGSSFQLKECCEHWRREIKQAVDAGKTVVVFLPDLQQVYIDTGERSYSGTGRNQKVTRHVALYDNYQAVPATLEPVVAKGNVMKLSPRGAESIKSFWAEFDDYFTYKVTLSAPKVPASILTKSGDKPVGAIYRPKNSSGSLVLLPDMDFYREDFLEEREDEHAWTAEAQKFASRLIASVVALDKALRAAGEVTPEPAWVTAKNYRLPKEAGLRAQLIDAEKQVEAAQLKKESIQDKLKATGTLRAVLYEKGKPLENAIIEALQIIGFNAEPFEDGTSEFDVVFESTEGRLIGEAEGKDNKSVNVEKLRQLSMNIHEDLLREEVHEPAKPVLFGNAYRLQPLSQRKEPFTEKCQTAAKNSSTALVFTPDLFAPVQYLSGMQDQEYARRCREAILSASGRVLFPNPPEPENQRGEQLDQA